MEANDAVLTLIELGPGVTVTAEPDGIWIRGWGTADTTRLTKTRLGRLLEAASTQMLEGGFAEEIGSDLHIAYANFVELDKHEIDAFEGIAPPAPLTLTLESSGWLGSPNFKYHYRFYFGSQVVYPRRVGCFVEHASRVYRLDNSTFALIQSIDDFNAESSESKSGRRAFLCFAKVKGLAGELGAQLDRFISRERILIASRVGLDLVPEPDGRISFAPKVEGIPDESLRQAFFASDDAETMYSLDDGEGGRVRVILDDEQREVLRRMQRVRHLGAADRDKVLRNPTAVFDGVAEHVDIDLDQFGPRVKGIGDFPFVVQPYVRISKESIFDGAVPTAPSTREGRPVEAGIECRYADGSIADVTFSSAEEAERFRESAREAWLKGQGVIEFEGKSIALNEALIRGLDEQSAALNAPSREADRPARRYLLIHTNEEMVDFAEEHPSETDTAATWELPHALRSDRPLKEHQKEGLAWLQRCFRTGRRGCLLADDMGLGKTLQVLAFLAWLIEQGELSCENSNPEAPPWDPILVAAPLVLIENEVWQRDMREFFSDDGSIFQPWLVVRGQELDRLKRTEDSPRSETLGGLSLLDVPELRKYRVIFTNYETITNYQFSFARRELNWSVVVTDEAQEYKTPNTKISHALKALTPRFRIASTGTPVETRLRDVWNIFDFLQPGDPLSSVSQFTREFEEPYQSSVQSSDAAKALGALRLKLKIGRDDTWIMRRDKRQRLPGLPDKKEYELTAPLSDEQRRMHIEIMKTARDSDARPLELLHQLTDVYQHPALRPRYEGISAEEAIARCPKLQMVIDCLKNVQSRDEKALIFASRKPMQLLLKAVIDQNFGLAVDIINGDSRARGDRNGASTTRRQMLDRFRANPGFDVLVLSPIVAGLGLTLVEANHVIHYGRWWNPALESQATDRIYRIGQTRPVHVYYPIAVDPLKELTTFDQKLDRIIKRRRRMAEDFLAPLAGEQEIQKELLEDVLS